MHTILAPGVAQEPEFQHVRDMFADDLATANLGITITSLSMGRCEGYFTIQPEMCNGHGTAQGGFLYTFADSLFAGACNSPGEVAVAVHNSIHYMAPAFDGDKIHGSAIIKQHWGRNGMVDVELTKDGKTIAEFRGTFRQLSAKPQARWAAGAISHKSAYRER